MNTSDLEGVKTKVCSKCKIEKPVERFSKDIRNKDELQERCRECYKEYYKEYYENCKESQKKYAKSNRDIINSRTAKIRAKKLQATPPWLTEKHLSDIVTYYTQSKTLEKATGIKYHVDHIVPLQGKNVCGLHVPWNLQVLTAPENIAKKNHYPDEWEDT